MLLREPLPDRSRVSVFRRASRTGTRADDRDAPGPSVPRASARSAPPRGERGAETSARNDPAGDRGRSRGRTGEDRLSTGGGLMDADRRAFGSWARMRSLEVAFAPLVVVAAARVETGVDARCLDSVEAHGAHEYREKSGNENRARDGPLDIGFPLEVAYRLSFPHGALPRLDRSERVTEEKRYRIAALHQAGRRPAAIARHLGRNRNTN